MKRNAITLVSIFAMSLNFTSALAQENQMDTLKDDSSHLWQAEDTQTAQNAPYVESTGIVNPQKRAAALKIHNERMRMAVEAQKAREEQKTDKTLDSARSFWGGASTEPQTSGSSPLVKRVPQEQLEAMRPNPATGQPAGVSRWDSLSQEEKQARIGGAKSYFDSLPDKQKEQIRAIREQLKQERAGGAQ